MTESSDASDDVDTNLICEIDHPLFDIIDNVTRRQVLRLIACEHNYGNRIAKLLDVSTPAIHRHLKFLKGNNPGELALIKPKATTKESYSGHKGGEATLYEVDAKVGLFFTIFPNFVHSHIVNVGDKGVKKVDASETPKELQNLRPISNKKLKEKLEKGEIDEISESNLKLNHIYKTVQKFNKKVIELQEELMEVLSIKNDFMGEVDEILKAEENLEYEDRVILRAVTCLGSKCSQDLTHFLNMDNYDLIRYVDRLREKGWME